MDACHDEDHDSTLTRAIGEELRRARDSVGWTRAELAARLSSAIHVQTLAGYERGSIQCTVKRFIEICRAIGVPASDVLSWAMQRAKIDLQATGLQVDLHALIKDKTPELLALRRWGRNRLAADPDGSGIAHLEWPALQEMAALIGFDRTTLINSLVMFTPGPGAQRR